MGMLSVSKLEQDIKSGMDDILPGAFEEALRCIFPNKTKTGDETAKKFGEKTTELLSGPLSKLLAGAIDYYVKSITLSGTIITAGSPVTQTAKIMPINIGNPTCGLVPNTIGLAGMCE